MKKLIMLYFFLAGGIAANTKNIDYTYLKMQSAPFEVDDDYLSKHDIVYFSPTQLEAEGFPMGNGDIAAWCGIMIMASNCKSIKMICGQRHNQKNTECHC